MGHKKGISKAACTCHSSVGVMVFADSTARACKKQAEKLSIGSCTWKNRKFQGKRQQSAVSRCPPVRCAPGCKNVKNEKTGCMDQCVCSAVSRCPPVRCGPGCKNVKNEKTGCMDQCECSAVS